jgi:arginine/lysine/ornithine decarboxylase
LIAAWQQIGKRPSPSGRRVWGEGRPLLPLLPRLSPRQASFAPTQPCPLDQAVGAISAALVCPYPPGIPVLMPGEQITAGAIATLQHIQTLGGRITGLTDPNTIQVISPSR